MQNHPLLQAGESRGAASSWAQLCSVSFCFPAHTAAGRKGAIPQSSTIHSKRCARSHATWSYGVKPLMSLPVLPFILPMETWRDLFSDKIKPKGLPIWITEFYPHWFWSNQIVGVTLKDSYLLTEYVTFGFKNWNSTTSLVVLKFHNIRKRFLHGRTESY